MSALPTWFFEVFNHLNESDINKLIHLWKTEPVLQKTISLLNEQNPSLNPPKKCPYCSSHQYLPNKRERDFRCSSCLRQSAATTGTPFADLHLQNYSILYAVLMTHWVNETIENVVWLSGCHNKTYWRDYANRLRKLISQIPKPVTQAPRYLHGFTPEVQGITCPLCHSSDTKYILLMPSANPDLYCQCCQNQFVMNPLMKRGVLIDGSKPAVPLWFEKIFAHTLNAEYEQLIIIWHREPLLRELADELDNQNPTLNRVYKCPYCNNHSIIQNENGYLCPACKSTFSATTGTIFQNMEKNRYQALYRVLILMWGQWNRNRALSIGKISTLGQLSVYERRIKKLLIEFQGEKIAPQPRWLMGFTLGEQGVRCLCCHSSDLQTVGRTVSPLDNPNVACKACGYLFKLNEWSNKH